MLGKCAFLVAVILAPLILANQSAAREVCAGDGADTCYAFPADQPEFQKSLEYHLVEEIVLEPFDAFSWQAFAALFLGDQSWRDFAPKDQLIARARSCAHTSDDLYFHDLKQADDTWLIDQSGNPIVYETRSNDVVSSYLRAANLDDLSFPQGVTGQQRPSVHLKTAWMYLPGETTGFLSVSGVAEVPAQASLDGEKLCLSGQWGLVGLHIMSKTASGHGDQWIWSTFEHRKAAPVSNMAREVNSIFAKELFPEGCPVNDISENYLLFGGGATSQETNRPPENVVLANAPPFARTQAGQRVQPSQIARCWKVPKPTQQTNAAWQARLKDTTLRHYHLAATQWRGTQVSPLFERGELPRFVSNVALESYLQTEPEGSCLGCHAGATTAQGDFADYTFFVGDLPQE